MTELILNNALQLPAVYPELTGGAGVLSIQQFESESLIR
jgi:hypothetical protein